MHVGWHPGHDPIDVWSGVPEQVAQAGRSVPAPVSVVKHKGHHSQLPVPLPEFLVVLNQALGCKTTVDGRPESHVPLRPALEFQ